MVSFAFVDPVRKQKLFYNVFGHRFDSNLTLDAAKTALIKRHLSKFARNAHNIEFTAGSIDENITFLETELKIAAPEGFPYVQKIKVKALFRGSYMAVQQIMGSNILMDAAFKDEILNQIAFTPERAMALLKKGNSKNTPSDAP